MAVNIFSPLLFIRRSLKDPPFQLACTTASEIPTSTRGSFTGIPAVLERHKHITVRKGKHRSPLSLVFAVLQSTPAPVLQTLSKQAVKGFYGFFHEHKAWGKSSLVLVPSGATPPPLMSCLLSIGSTRGPTQRRHH